MSSLNRRQTEEFRRKVGPIVEFFYRCKRRLESLGFTEHDKMLEKVKEVNRALEALNFELWESGPYSTKARTEELPPPGDRTF